MNPHPGQRQERDQPAAIVSRRRPRSPFDVLLLLLFASSAGTSPHQWSPLPSPVSVPLHAVAAAGHGGFVAVGEGGTLLTSTDGRTWMDTPSPTSATLRGVAAGGTGYVAVGDGGVVLASIDGTAWVSGESRTTGRLNAVAWTGTYYVAVGAAPKALLSGLILTSTDGLLWTDRTPADVRPLYGVAGRDGHALAVGWTGAIAESPDGVAWTSSSLGSVMHQCWFMLRPSYLFAAALRPGRRVAVGLVVGDQYPGAGVALAQGEDRQWRCVITELPPLQFQFRAVAATPTGLVAVGLGGIAESNDGLTWTSQWTAPTPTLLGVAAGPRHWVAVGEGGSLLIRDAPPLRPPRRLLRSSPAQ